MNSNNPFWMTQWKKWMSGSWVGTKNCYICFEQFPGREVQATEGCCELVEKGLMNLNERDVIIKWLLYISGVSAVDWWIMITFESSSSSFIASWTLLFARGSRRRLKGHDKREMNSIPINSIIRPQIVWGEGGRLNAKGLIGLDEYSPSSQDRNYYYDHL